MGDERDHGRGGVPGPDRRLRRGAAGQGRDRRGDGRPGARPCSRTRPRSSAGPVTDLVGTGGDGAHTVNISTMATIVAAACGRPDRQARQPGGLVGVRRGGRARGARRRDRPAAGRDRGAGRRGRRGVPVRAAVPPGVPAHRPGAAGAGRAHGVQLPRPADQPGAARLPGRGRRRPADGRRARGRAGRARQLGAGVPRRAAWTSSPPPARPRCGWSPTAPCRRPSSTRCRSGCPRFAGGPARRRRGAQRRRGPRGPGRPARAGAGHRPAQRRRGDGRQRRPRHDDRRP